MKTVFTSMEELPDTNRSIVVKLNSVIDFLCTLEGAKTKIKNLHWAAFAMNIHKQLDELLDVVSDFQDILAEGYMGIEGQLSPNAVSGTPCDCTDPINFLKTLTEKTMIFYSSLQDPKYIGIKSETETFIYNLNKQTYLFSLCKG